MAMNRDLALMPCLAIKTQTSPEVVPNNVPFNGAEMCGIIIRSLPQDWQTQYQVVNGHKNQTKIHALIIDLEAIEKVMDQKRKEKDTLTKKKSTAKSPGKNEKGSEKRGRAVGMVQVTHSVSPRSSVQISSVTAARSTEELTPSTTQVIVIVTKPMVLQIRSTVPNSDSRRKGRMERTSPTKGAGTNRLNGPPPKIFSRSFPKTFLKRRAHAHDVTRDRDITNKLFPPAFTRTPSPPKARAKPFSFSCLSPVSLSVVTCLQVELMRLRAIQLPDLNGQPTKNISHHSPKNKNLFLKKTKNSAKKLS